MIINNFSIFSIKEKSLESGYDLSESANSKMSFSPILSV